MSNLLESTISYPEHLEDIVTIAVTDFGIDNFVMGGSTLQSGTKPESSITCYLETAEEVATLCEFIQKRIATSTLDGAISCQSTPLAKEQWEESWKQYWKPITIADKLIVAPTWECIEPSAEQIVVRLDTTMAFGTGSHETTKLCLELLLRCAQKQPNAFLDVGCGSGVLAISAAKLGIADVSGIDISPQIIETAQQNAAVNQVSNIAFSTTPVADLSQSYPLVAANIISSILLKIWRDLLKRVAPGGQLIVSGILVEELEDFLIDICLEPEMTKTENDWAALLFQL